MPPVAAFSCSFSSASMTFWMQHWTAPPIQGEVRPSALKLQLPASSNSPPVNSMNI